jgi:hypothetical protein
VLALSELGFGSCQRPCISSLCSHFPALAQCNTISRI